MKKCFIKACSFCKKYSEILSTIIASTTAFLLTFLVFRYVFTKNDIYPFGNLSIAWCDLKQQGIPLLMNLKDVLCGDGSFLYSFNNASGMNFWGVFLFFISTPFSFLVAFFEKSDVYKLVSALIIFKLCLSAFTATFALSKMCKKTYKGINVALGISYGLCAYGLMYSQNIMWLDIMYLYPLLVYGIYRVTDYNKYGLYTAVLSLCVLFNFYLSYMVILSILVLIGLYFIISKDDKEKKKVVGFNFLKGSAIAALISAISWIPAFLQYSASARGEDLFETLANSSWGTTKSTIYLLVLSSTVIIMALFSFFKPTRRKTSIFIALVLFALPIINEPINKMWHTGSYMSFPGRYAFITIFIGLYLVGLTLEPGEKKASVSTDEENIDSDLIITPVLPSDKKFSVKHILNTAKSIKEKITENNIINVTLAISLCLVLFHNLSSNVSFGIFNENREALSEFTNTLWGDEEQLKLVYKVSKIFVAFYVSYVILFKLKVFQKRIFSIILVSVVLCEGIFAINTYAVTVADKNVFNGYDEFLDLEGRIDDEDFYRIKTEKEYIDSNLVGALGYNSIGHYTSLTNLEYMNTAKALGYSSAWMNLATYGGTELSDAILGIRYNIKKSKNENGVYTNETYSIEETFASLGLGVKYSGKNDVFYHNESSRTDFQEKIFSSLFDTDEKLFEKYDYDEIKGCSISEEDGKTVIIGKGTINYNIWVEGEQTLYFDAISEYSNSLRQQINKGFSIYVNEKKITSYPDGTFSGFAKLGTFKNQNVKIKIVVVKSEMELLSYGVSGLKRDVLKEAVEKTESGFIDARGNKAFGTVTANEGEYLFVSIPYDEGFTVKVNGKKVKAEKVFGDFYSIPLTKGLNKIEMVYVPAGFVSGLIMAVFGLAICVLLAVFSKKEKSKVRTFIENKLGVASKPIFTLLFVLVIGLIYIMPVCINIWFK